MYVKPGLKTIMIKVNPNYVIVSSPDPTSRLEKGLVSSVHFLGYTPMRATLKFCACVKCYTLHGKTRDLSPHNFQFHIHMCYLCM